MDKLLLPTVIDIDGQSRTFQQISESQVSLELEKGLQGVVPIELLEQVDDSTYLLPISFARLTEQQPVEEGTLTIPVVAEKISFEKRTVKTATVRIKKEVHEHQESVDEPLLHEKVHVRRVEINKPLPEPVDSRYEGNTLVIPVMKEVLVVQKQLMLVEEVHITREKYEEYDPQTVTLRRENLVVDRVSHLTNTEPEIDRA